MSAALEIDRLTKAFGSRLAVSGLSLRIELGEIVGLLGPNGAGKTTTISCAAGLLEADLGRIAIDGAVVGSSSRTARRRLGVCMQRLALYPYLTVRQNLEFYCGISGRSKAQTRAHVADAISLFGLGAIVERPVRDLSVGQQRLAHVASAVVARPRVLLVDEPTAGLDVTARQRVVTAMRRLAADGAAILYSSHHLAEVEELCERIVILNYGEVLAEGFVSDLVERYGGGHVEIVLQDRVIIERGTDPSRALAVMAREDVRSARMVAPSLEAVFVHLTGEHALGMGSEQ